MTFVPNREELAWAAGFFDGEGHAAFYPRPGKGQRKLELAQTGPFAVEILERFRSAVGGGGVIAGPYTGSNALHAPSYRFRDNSYNGVQAIAAMLWPFLSGAKKQQLIAALTPKPLARTHCRNGHEYTVENVRYESGYRRCRACRRIGEARRSGRTAA